jgi:hypothetical protein
LRISENREQRRIMGPKGEEVVEEWSKVYNMEIIICVPQQILFMSLNEGRGNGYVACTGEKRYCSQNLGRRT